MHHTRTMTGLLAVPALLMAWGSLRDTMTPLGLLDGVGSMGSRSSDACVAVALISCTFVVDVLGYGCVWLSGTGDGTGGLGQS